MISLYCNDCKQDHGKKLAKWCDRSSIEIENEKLKKALEIAKEKLGFYALEDNWLFSSEYGTPSIRTEIKSDHDCHLGCSGKRARQALKEIEEVLR